MTLQVAASSSLAKPSTTSSSTGLEGLGPLHRPGYIYLFGENKEQISSDNLKIFGKVGKFRTAQECSNCNLSDK